MESTLIIEGVGFPTLSAREVTQSLTPIQQGEMRRSVNGELCYIGTASHHKYKSRVFCEDQNLPGLQQLWVGERVRVHCIPVLWERFILGEETLHALSRSAVPGSITLVAPEELAYTLEENLLTLPTGNGQEVMVSYRPILEMRITEFGFKNAEWEQGTGWCLDLEEV